MFRDGNENTGWQGHVEDSVALLPALLDFVNVLVKLLERRILIVLAGNICADGAELIELFLNFFRGGLDIRFDSPKVLVVVHLSPSISDDLDVFGEEFVAVLGFVSRVTQRGRVGARREHTRPKSAGKVFFFARSPEAPRTTMTVFSLSSMVLWPQTLVYNSDELQSQTHPAFSASSA